MFRFLIAQNYHKPRISTAENRRQIAEKRRKNRSGLDKPVMTMQIVVNDNKKEEKS